MIEGIKGKQVHRFLLNVRGVTQDSLPEFEKDEKKWKWLLLILVVFILALMLGYSLRCYVCPCSWVKTSLTVSATPHSQVRGKPIQFAGSLEGEDIAGKTINFDLTDASGNLIKTLTATTDADGFYHLTGPIPVYVDPGKYTVTASYEDLTDMDNFFIKLVAPQEHGL